MKQHLCQQFTSETYPVSCDITVAGRVLVSSIKLRIVKSLICSLQTALRSCLKFSLQQQVPHFYFRRIVLNSSHSSPLLSSLPFLFKCFLYFSLCCSFSLSLSVCLSCELLNLQYLSRDTLPFSLILFFTVISAASLLVNLSVFFPLSLVSLFLKSISVIVLTHDSVTVMTSLEFSLWTAGQDCYLDLIRNENGEAGIFLVLRSPSLKSTLKQSIFESHCSCLTLLALRLISISHPFLYLFRLTEGWARFRGRPGSLVNWLLTITDSQTCVHTCSDLLDRKTATQLFNMQPAQQNDIQTSLKAA